MACSWLVFTKTVVKGTGEPPQELHQVTVVEPLTKLEPLTVRVTEFEVPTTALDGEIEVTPEALTLKFRPFETTWLTESVTVSVAVPAVVNKLAGTVAVIDVEELAVTVRGVATPPNVQSTMVDDVGRLVPVSVRENADCPAVAVVWLKLLRTGLGETAKVWVVETT